MYNSHLQYLCCPKCKCDLRRSDDVLVCQNCSQNFTIKHDIPILVDLENLPQHLLGQISYFENEPDYQIGYRLADWQKSYLERFKNNFGDFGNKMIVDCGAGSGYMTIELAKLGAKVTACDLTLKSLVKLKKEAESLGFGGKIIFVCCSAEELPFQTGIADYFISNAVLEHLTNEKEAIAEISRVCKNNAGLMVTAPLSYQYLNLLLLPINYYHDKQIGHLRRYNQDILVDKFNNWQLIKSYYTGHFSKVIKVLFNMIYKIFKEDEIETKDKKRENKKWWASNIIVFFKKSFQECKT